MTAKGDPIFVGLTAATGPVLQPGSRFSNKTYGLDDGRRTYLVHPNCSLKLWPQKGAADKENTGMYVVDVTDSNDASTLVQLEVSYQGIAGKKPNRVTPDCDVQMLTIPVLQGGSSASLLLPVPQPTSTNEYVATVQPTLTGVGKPVAATASWTPTPPTWSASFVPDPSKPPTYNYYVNQWVLQSRSWQEIIPGKLWFVREKAVYNFAVASA